MKRFNDVLGNFILVSPYYSKFLKDAHGSQGHYDLISTIDLAELLRHAQDLEDFVSSYQWCPCN